MSISQITTATTHASSWDSGRTWQPPMLPASRAQRRLLTDPIVAKLTLPSSEVELVVPQPEPSWLYPILSRLQHLSRLGENWDSYSGHPPTDTSVFTTLAVVVRLLRDQGDVPAIVPTSEGGIQVEWHRDSGELEIRVGPDGELSAFRFDEQGRRAYDLEHVRLSDLSNLLELVGGKR